MPDGAAAERLIDGDERATTPRGEGCSARGAVVSDEACVEAAVFALPNRARP
jgi:hypothetical protein